MRPGTLCITRQALATIRDLVASHQPAHTETGGILLGRTATTVPEIVTAGDPGPDAVHSPTRFRRDLIHAQRLATDAWATDRCEWVGEWHTHPNGPLRPSDYDLATYLELLARPGLRLPWLVALIVMPTPLTIAAWQIAPDEVRPFACRLS